jgi:uncharacterized membrane protein required for colicin V production
VPVTLLDGAIVAIIAIAALRGFFRGFVREAFAVLAWVAGAVVAYAFLEGLRRPIGSVLGVGSPVDAIVAGSVLFLAAYVGVRLAGWTLHRIVRAVLLGPVDRVAGVALGGAKGAALIALVLWIAAAQRLAPSIVAPIESAPIAGVLLEVARETRDAIAGALPPSGEPEEETRA